MTQQQQHAQLSHDGKRKLAAQLVATTRLDTSLKLLEGWDRDTALTTLLELHTDAERFAPRARANYRQYLIAYALTCLASFLLWGFESGPVVLLFSGIVPLFLYCAHRATASEKGTLQAQIAEVLLEYYLPTATPSDLPAVLEIGARLGSPEAHPPLKATLIRLLPYFSESTAAALTPSQHRFLLRLLPTADEELLLVTLLALGTLGDPRDADPIRFTASGLSLRVREAKQECLETLESRIIGHALPKATDPRP